MLNSQLTISGGNVYFCDVNISAVVGRDLGVRQSLSKYSKMADYYGKLFAKIQKKLINKDPVKYRLLKEYNPSIPFEKKEDRVAFVKLATELHKQVREIRLQECPYSIDDEIAFYVQMFLQNNRRVSKALENELQEQRKVGI